MAWPISHSSLGLNQRGLTNVDQPSFRSDSGRIQPTIPVPVSAGIPQSSVQHPRYFEDLPEPEENATIVVPTDIFRNCLHPNLRYPKSVVSENFQAVPLGQGRPYIHPSTSFSSPVIRIGLFMIAKVDAIVDSGSGAKNNVIYEDLLSRRS